MTDRIIGIQAGAASFVDEGVGAVLDTVQERAGANTLFLASVTWSRTTGGRAEPGYPHPGHGSTDPDTDWRGGNFATVHPEYYGGTMLGAAGRATEHPGWDMLAAVVPEARRRGLACYAVVDESSQARHLRSYPNFLKCLEYDIWNKPARRPCFNNPDYRNWHLGIVEDTIKNYDLDGLLWSSERISPLDRLIQEPTRQGLGLVTCYCEHCRRKGEERGLDWRRAQEGYRKLVLWNADVARGERPAEGAFVSFWRLLASYPELLGWQSLWIDGQHQIYRDIFGTARAFRPEMKIGWSMPQILGFSPFFRATQVFGDLSHISDFVKLSTYDTAGGPRLRTWVDNVCKAVLGDVAPKLAYPVLTQMLGLEEADLDHLAREGLSADFVRRETRRALVGGEGRWDVLAGIDAGVPVGQAAAAAAPEPSPGDVAGVDHDLMRGDHLVRHSRERVAAAVTAAFAGGATGVVLGPKYAQMRLDVLDGVRDALARLA